MRDSPKTSVFSGEVLANAERVLRRFPLCDRCLGRLFARYGYAMSNLSRGRAIKTALAMAYHPLVERGEEGARDALAELARNAGYPLTELARYYGIGVEKRPCYICGNRIEFIIPDLVKKAAERLKGIEFSSLVVGVKQGSLIEMREREVIEYLNTDSWEEVRREVRREVGKALQRLTGVPAEFREPDVVVLLDLDKQDVEVLPQPVYVRGRYVKGGRMISQLPWITREGLLKYSRNITDAVRKVLMPLFYGDDVVLHAAGREDADARMLGWGRPFIAEITSPRRRRPALPERAGEYPWIVLSFEGLARHSDVTRVKTSRPMKAYRVIALVHGGVSEEDVKEVEERLKGTVVKQLTPKRVLRRKKEYLRERRVVNIRGRVLGGYVAEFFLVVESGLYVKELFHGDEGRTEPSVASILGREVEVLFLDVLEVLGE